MDGFEEKKWFIYLGDHHEGPFSLEEVQNKMGQGQVSGTNYVWAEGMGDWKAMNEVPAFESIIGNARGQKTTPGHDSFFDSPVIQVVQDAPEPKAKPQPVKEEKITMDRAPIDRPVERGEIKLDALDLRTGSGSDEHKAPPKSSFLSKIVGYGLFLFLISAGVAYFQGYLDPLLTNPAVRAAIKTATDTAQPVLLKATEKYPALAQWISPIPSIDDIASSDYEELKAAAGASLEKAGPRIAVALATSDPLRPTFYVSTNLPEGSSIDVYVEGIADSLLNQLSFSGKSSATVTHRLGKSAPIKLADGKPLPRGQYEIFAIESESLSNEAKAILAAIPVIMDKVPATLPKGFKLLAQKSYFLGGPKDAAYSTRLKEFHDKIKEKATQELAEIKQFSALFDSQLNEGSTKFNRLMKLKANPKIKVIWADENQKYLSFSKQVNEAFSKWTPEVLEKEFFYGALYTKIMQTFRAIDDMHKLQNSYFTGHVDKNAFDIQLGQATAVALTVHASLKAKIDQAEKIQPSPNGMPRREGL